MSGEYLKKENFAGQQVEVLGETYEKGKPQGEGVGRWSHKLEGREEILKYLRTAEKYWYAEEKE